MIKEQFLGLIVENCQVRTFIKQQIISRKKDLKIQALKCILSIQCLLLCMEQLQEKHHYLNWKHVQTKLFVLFYLTRIIVPHF